MTFTIEQRVFINNTCIKCSSWRRCRCRFQRKLPEVHPPSKYAIYKIAKQFRETGSVLNKKPERKYRVLTDERLNDIGTRLQVSPRKSLTRLAAQCGISRSTVHIAKIKAIQN
ncbi:hypothetical protein C0J52_07946 [Blattella germanica]|nr:hypothetical protein C0J52_07946 [Blattella germanica]PSN39895.1 hypothetical protein C0J52_07946 [Blattella germanica]PSN39896.1 hypothetical protein C0J52_07946 [Blattella germanica]PSN39897.1 hypothetical protein C0J52_07946 [Blattella germanica]PSN39898.1 hypothetical protein C0J52_07946 [Blattella germanica]